MMPLSVDIWALKIFKLMERLILSVYGAIK